LPRPLSPHLIGGALLFWGMWSRFGDGVGSAGSPGVREVCPSQAGRVPRMGEIHDPPFDNLPEYPYTTPHSPTKKRPATWHSPRRNPGRKGRPGAQILAQARPPSTASQPVWRALFITLVFQPLPFQRAPLHNTRSSITVWPLVSQTPLRRNSSTWAEKEVRL